MDTEIEKNNNYVDKIDNFNRNVNVNPHINTNYRDNNVEEIINYKDNNYYDNTPVDNSEIPDDFDIAEYGDSNNLSVEEVLSRIGGPNKSYYVNKHLNDTSIMKYDREPFIKHDSYNLLQYCDDNNLSMDQCLQIMFNGKIG